MQWIEEIEQRRLSCQDFRIGTTPQVLLQQDVPKLLVAVKFLYGQLNLVGGMCGNPDASEGCRVILKHCKDLKKILDSGENFERG